LNPVRECGILSTFSGTVLQKLGWVVTIVRTGVKIAFALHVNSCIDELCNDCEEEEEEEGDKCDLESVASFAKAFVPYKTIKQLFYMPSIGGCNKKNILDLELALYGLNCKALK
jgi:hypothetical protein